MLCPNCRNTMRERGKVGVIADVCPGCHGIWLEAGELEKLIESERRYYELLDGDRYAIRQRDERFGLLDERPRVEQYRCRDEGQMQPKKRRSFLSSLFELVRGD